MGSAKYLCGIVAVTCFATGGFDHLLAGEEYPELPRRISKESDECREARLSWWRQARFGMFIHFGLYAASGRGEWTKSVEFIDNATYDAKYLPRFHPDLFDARAWAKTAKAAGMRYAVLTAKHHEGFCMWDTATTDYKITKTEFGRDVVREFVEAFRAEGLGVGLYFSIKDWHHPDYIIDSTHPLRPHDQATWTKEKFDAVNKGRVWQRYKDYMYAQIEELLQNYGKIDIIWYDYTVKHEFGKTYRDWDSIRLVNLTRKLQPDILINNRLDLMDTDDGWDFVTPEQTRAIQWPTVRGKRVPWETCQTFSGSWGYSRDEETWKSIHQLVGLLVHSVSLGGNLILNVGPTARGEFDGRAMQALAGMGAWMRQNARAVYGCGMPPEGFVAPSGTEMTYNEKTCRLYLHLCEYPMGFLPLPFFEKVEYAQFLHDGSEVRLCPPRKESYPNVADDGKCGGLALPMRKPNVEVPVVEMWLK